MKIIIGALGIGQIAFGTLMWAASRSAMHETTSATLVGLGVLALGMAAIISRMDAHAKSQGRGD